MKGVAWIIRQSLLKHEIRTNKNISRNWSAIIADYEKKLSLYRDVYMVYFGIIYCICGSDIT